MVRFGSPAAYPTDAQQSAFLSGAASMMAALGYVQRYAWFALPVSTGVRYPAFTAFRCPRG